MLLADFRKEIVQHNIDHPDLKNCIYPNCPNKIKPAWDNEVMCFEHQLVMEYWFYEEDGALFCPDIWDFPSGKKLPRPRCSDPDMTAYRKRYCDWIAALSPQQYLDILKIQIGDEGK
jgi:hypothetical protein